MKKKLKHKRWQACAVCLLLWAISPVVFAQESLQVAPPDQQTNTSSETKDKSEPSASASSGQNQPRPWAAAQKLRYGTKAAFLNPGAFIGPAFSAYFTERNELRVPAKTQRDYFADGMSFYARAFARQSTAEFLASGIYPALFHQDPRYYHSSNYRFGARLFYATSRTFVTRSDAGQSQVNYAKLAGYFTSAALANAYDRNTPKRVDAQGKIIALNQRTGTAATFRNVGILLASDVIGKVFFNEFRLGDKIGAAVKKVFGR